VKIAPSPRPVQSEERIVNPYEEALYSRYHYFGYFGGGWRIFRIAENQTDNRLYFIREEIILIFFLFIRRWCRKAQKKHPKSPKMGFFLGALLLKH
jgi:hypothetical protein